MFIKQAFKGENDWWRYLLVTILVLIGYQIGSAPLVMALYRAKAKHPELDLDVQEFFSNPDFSQFYINDNLGLTLMLLVFVAAMVTFYFLFRPIHKREFKTLTRTKTTLNWGKILFAFLLWLTLSACFEAIGYFMSPEGYEFTFRWNTFIPLLVISVLILPIQTSFEEIFFRGYLLQGIGISRWTHIMAILAAATVAYVLDKALVGRFSNSMDVLNAASFNLMAKSVSLLVFGTLAFILVRIIQNRETNFNSTQPQNFKFIPLIVTSILFGLVHSANPEIEKFGFMTMQMYYISAGLFLGILTLMDDTLELALGVHAATNFTGAVLVGYDGGAIKTESLFTSHQLNAQLMLVGFFVIAGIFLLIVKSKYKWGSFSKLIEPIYKPDEDLALNQLFKDTKPTT